MDSNNSPFPFYVHPMGRKRSVQIIKEAKAEIKKMESLRPSTPFNKKILQNQNSVVGVSRPSSGGSIKSLKYEHEEKSSKRILLNAKKDAGDLKLEPIVTKPPLCLRKSFYPHMKRRSNTAFSGFPPLPYEDKLNRVPIKSEAKDQNLNFLSQSLSGLSLDKTYDSESEISAQDKQEVEELKDEELSFLIESLEQSFLLEKNEQAEEAIHIVESIHNALEERNAFTEAFSERVNLLKLLFKLLDSSSINLSISIVKVLLPMKVEGNNLTNILRLVLRLLKDDGLSKIDEQIIKTLFDNLEEISVLDNIASTSYAIRILKLLLHSNCLNKDLLVGSLAVLNHYLEEFIRSAKEWDTRENQIIIQSLSLLHYLTENEVSRKLLIKSDCLLQVMKVLHCFSQQTHIVEITIRFISKFIDLEGCESLTRCPENLLFVFLRILEIYKNHIDITLQITFIIGNFVCFNEETAHVFLSSPTFISIVMGVLNDYVHEHLHFKGMPSEKFKTENCCGDRDWNYEIYGVILKILCIWANACLQPKAGTYLAQQPLLISQLLSIIGMYEEESVTPFLVVIGNISYYMEASSNMCIMAMQRVVPFLESSLSIEVKLESANIVRNLTRHEITREYVYEYSLLQLFLKLLIEDNRDFNRAVYGIIMNLLIDQRIRTMFYQEQGVTRVLHKLHLCAERDWKTSAMMCQILWNYCCRESSSQVFISKLEVQHLIKFLSYSINSKKIVSDVDCCDEYINDFCPVAKKLLELLKDKNIELS